MGPEYYRLHADVEELEFDQKIRGGLLQGCRMVKEMEEKLHRTPAGQLGKEDSFELRTALAISSLEIISTFNENAKLILSSLKPPPTSPSVPLDNCIALPPQKRPFAAVEKSSPDARRARVEYGNNAESPLSSTRNGEPPPVSPAGRANAAAKVFTPSPPRSCNSEMSDGCRAREPVRGEARAAGSEGAETAENEAVCIGKDVRDSTRKRTLMPKFTLRMPASNLDQGVDIPPDDGHTWRKYGQKTILCSSHPRSYYRCTHKPDLGCQAIKQVQRCDDNSAIFDVTYRGHHTCRSAHLDQQTWPFAFPHPLSLVNTQFVAAQGANLRFSTSPSMVPLPLLSGIGSVPLANSASLTLKPPRVTLDSLAVAPKFGTWSGQVEPDNHQSQHVGLREGCYEYSSSKDSANPRTATQCVSSGGFKLDETQKSGSEEESRRLELDQTLELQPKANYRGELTSSERRENLHVIPFSSSQDWSLKDANPEATPISQSVVSLAWSVQQCEPAAVRSLTGSTGMHRTAEISKESSEEVPASSLFDDPMDLYPEIQQLVPRRL